MKKATKIPGTIFLLAAMTVLMAGCAEGPYQTRTDDVSGFNRIRIETFGEIIIEQGDEESLSIDAPRDYLRYILTDVNDGMLTISTRRGFLGGPIRRVTYTITVKDLNEISLSGAGERSRYSSYPRMILK